MREALEAVEQEETTMRAAKETLEDLEQIVRRSHEAFLDSDRIKVGGACGAGHTDASTQIQTQRQRVSRSASTSLRC